jgi:SP family arabinose:H+ symporter-like MFS transporter
VKGFASGVVACQASLTIFVIVKIFPMMVMELGAHGTYYFYAIMCLATSIVSWFFTPDTRGKTAAELQMLYHKKSKITDAM